MVYIIINFIYKKLKKWYNKIGDNMSDEAINKAVSSSVSNNQIENDKMTEQEINLIKESLKKDRKIESLIYNVYKMHEEEIKKTKQKKKW